MPSPPPRPHQELLHSRVGDFCQAIQLSWALAHADSQETRHLLSRMHALRAKALYSVLDLAPRMLKS